ncbi:xylulokinase [Albimonas donghaensis]|uniref:Xylulose kinase n=1 Tax=Albimonas donghaensis TaxID=356660 RepID=A0A1H3BM53_9RHOB|nr:xylulokinase [Albimonas donghaensis]SDX42855.1 xylulokinase [Albimonas donghaensis]
MTGAVGMAGAPSGGRYLGLDLGTSGLKALLIDGAQRVVASADAGLEVSRPRPGWSEQSPEAWLAAADRAVAALAAQAPEDMGRVRGIGLSGQMHGATLLDEADRPLRPCILWDDVRSAAEAARLDADPRFRAISGNIVFPGFTAPKLAWMATHEPALFARIRKVLLPKDYLRLWLTGAHVSDVSDAAGTGWLDVGARAWSPDLLAAGGMERGQMPELVEGTEVSGTLRPALARRWGMPEGVVVAGGGGDNAASAIGTGAVRPGAAFVSLGTSGVLFAATGRCLPAPDSAVHAFCHALPGMWCQMGVILSAASALDWFARIAGQPASALAAELDETAQAPGPVAFLPYLAGERTPHNDAAVRGGFFGLSHAADRPMLTRAVMDGVAFCLRDCLDALRAAGQDVERATAVGGGSRSRVWLISVANALGVPIDIPASGEFGATLGAARLALIAAEGAEPMAVCAPPATESEILPDPALADAYAAAHGRHRGLYPALGAAGG